MSNGNGTVQLPDVTVSSRNTGQTVDSASGAVYLQPQLITRPRMQVRGIYPQAKMEEIATLVVNGYTYEDWETVWFQYTLGDPWAQFKFTATEDDPWVSEGSPRFKPGDKCILYLGGYPVMHGVILIRQVAYDAHSHTIVLQGASISYYAANASIIDDKNEYEGKFIDIAAKILAPTCSGYKVWGELSELEFKDPQRPEPSDTIFSFLTRLGQERKIIVTSDPYGNFLFIGEHSGEVVGDIIEGSNILKCQAILADLKVRDKFIRQGSSAGNDQHNGADAAQQRAVVPGTAQCYNPLLTPMEHPVWTPAEMELAAQNDLMVNEGQTKVEVTVTLQGWFNPRTGQRWDVGQDVNFQSPMTGIDDMMLKIRTITFTQDKNGSLSTLVLVAPWGFNDKRFSRGGGPPGQAQYDPNTVEKPPVRTPETGDQQ